MPAAASVCTAAGLCPTGRAWADEATAVDEAHNEAECSNRGTCDYRIGKCVCEEGFEGLACQRSECCVRVCLCVCVLRVGACAGACGVCVCVCVCANHRILCYLVAVSCRNDCNFHGRCVSMNRLAIDAQHSTQQAFYSVLWDAHMIHGCQCDLGFEGHDCTLRQVRPALVVRTGLRGEQRVTSSVRVRGTVPAWR